MRKEIKGRGEKRGQGKRGKGEEEVRKRGKGERVKEKGNKRKEMGSPDEK